MRKSKFAGLLAGAALFGVHATADAEILAMVNYESKVPESLKELKLSLAPQPRREGIAVIDVDPKSPRFGDIIMDIPLPPDLFAHHIFYDRTMTKAYITALGKPQLHVMDLTKNPFRITRIDVPQCQVGEDVVLSDDNLTWYLTCMGSEKVVVGDVASDKIKAVIDLKGTYAHGLAVHSGIDRALVTSTVRASDLGNPGEHLTVIKASTNEVLGKIKVSNKKSPSGEAPVEILFVPGTNPPVAYVTNMFGAALWTATWNQAKQDFDAAEAFDFKTVSAGVPLEIYFNDTADRLYVTTASPGKFHVFDISANPAKPKLLQTTPTAEGAHHVAFTKDGSLAFVQNAFINLPGMRDGSISVLDMKTGKVIASIDTLKNTGYNPNCIVLLPEWNSLAGH